MSNYFAELQLQVNSQDTTITDTRKQMNEIVKIFKSLPKHREYIEMFAQSRPGIKPETFEAADCFFVDEEYPVTLLPKELMHDSLGMCNGFGFVYEGRFVYPLKDVKGDVMGWCGYDAFEQPKYLDSSNYGYKAKESTLYGMECLEAYYKASQPVFITEGIVCALWLRQQGFNAMALLGSYLSPYVAEILKRFGRRCIIVPDADEAGNNLAKSVRYKLPTARIIQSRVAKDIDDTQRIVPDLTDDLTRLLNPFSNSKYFRIGGP